MINRKRIMFVFGTRPEAIKMAPVVERVQSYPDILQPIVVVTGQHRQMLDQVLRIFDIQPDYDLGIMEENQTLTSIVTKAMQGLEDAIIKEKPDMLLVQGDTSTSFAAALEAYYYKIPLGHVEAGLRTFDKWHPFPEEINRRLNSVIADLHFAPTRTSVANLKAEGVSDGAIYLTGNTVIDALLQVAGREYDLKKGGIELVPNKKVVLVTTHRRESFGRPLRNTCQAISRLAQTFSKEIQIVIPVHKNPIVKNTVNEYLGEINNILLIEPLDYLPFVHLMKSSYLILTDSGGVQEEAPSLGKPVLVLRDKTERPEAVVAGTVKLVGTDEELIYSESVKLLTEPAAYQAMSRAVNPYGDGVAAERIVQAMLYYFGATDKKPREFSTI